LVSPGVESPAARVLTGGLLDGVSRVPGLEEGDAVSEPGAGATSGRAADPFSSVMH
jgi:hypothetical protein